ncbi:MAG: CDP-alcohol phosphatidyltransferase family protein [Pseudomonadota bacterium]
MRTDNVPEEPTERIERDSNLLHSEIKSWWIHRVMGPLERFCIERRILPNHITLAATALCVLIFVRFAGGHILTAGWLVLLVGSLDVLDGRVARASNRVTHQGAFLDSVMDRYQDFLSFAGLAVFYRDSWLLYMVLLALGGTMFVPYVRAKADTMGIDLSKVGTMQRPERFFLLGFGSIVSSLFQISLMPMSLYGHGNPPPQHILIFVILVLAVSTNWTAFRRIQHSLRHLKEEERR